MFGDHLPLCLICFGSYNLIFKISISKEEILNEVLLTDYFIYRQDVLEEFIKLQNFKNQFLPNALRYLSFKNDEDIFMSFFISENSLMQFKHQQINIKISMI